MNETISAHEETHGDPQGLVSARRVATSPVLEFLRLTLADGPVAVAEIEAKARAVRLLGPGRKITDAKLFRRSKTRLRIRSVRIGFGGAGCWCWELPMPAGSAVSERREQPPTKDVPPGDIYVERHSDSEERCAGASAEARLPPVRLTGLKTGDICEVEGVATWIACVALLNPNRPIAGIPPLRWRQFIDDCGKFLDPANGWAERAFQMDWSTFDLFGCRAFQPLAHLGVAGLLWAVNGGRVIEIHRGWGMIEQANNGSRRNFDQRRSRQASLTLPWWIG